MRDISCFDLDSRYGRYAARKEGHDIPKMQPGKKPREFWPQVEKKSVDCCWIWKGRVDRCGYGVYSINGKCEKAHRYAYFLQTGEKIGNCIAMHICDTPSCCNPSHLVLGTHADNQNDKFKKGRQAKGSKCGTSILTEDVVLLCREIYSKGGITYDQLAKKYDVCKDTMQKAIRGVNWRHV